MAACQSTFRVVFLGSAASAITGRKLETSTESDPDEPGSKPDWTQAVTGLPVPTNHINIRIEHDVPQWFKSRGKGYRTLMNNVLRAFVKSRQQRSARP